MSIAVIEYEWWKMYESSRRVQWAWIDDCILSSVSVQMVALRPTSVLMAAYMHHMHFYIISCLYLYC